MPDAYELLEAEVSIYLEWASDSENSGNIEGAISILQNGYSKCGDSRLQQKIDEYKEILQQAALEEESSTKRQDTQVDEEPEQQYRLVEGYYKDPTLTLRQYISYEGDSIIESTANTRFVFEPTDKMNEYRNYDRDEYVQIIILTGDDKFTYELREADTNVSLLDFNYRYLGQTLWG